VTKLLSLLAFLFLGRKEEAQAHGPEIVMAELAETDRLEATAAKHLMKRRRL
jgi:hypothetical protein